MVNERSKQLLTALTSLDEAIKHFKLQETKKTLDEYRRSRDSLIQRFEYCADLFWKFLNDYLRRQMSIDVEIARPKAVFKESHLVGFITKEELAQCNRLTEDRNRTSHTYHEQLAEHIADKICSYYTLMDTISKRLLSTV